MATLENFTATESPKDLQEVMAKCETLKPKDLVIAPLKWRFLLRTVFKGQNVMMTGPTGAGKTLAAYSTAKALNRPFFKFNLGSSQDPRAMLIGNVSFSGGETKFNPSKFAQAVQTPYAVILLDEFTRAHPEAHNILMPVLDEGQRFMQLDEDDNQIIIEVHPTVSFIATANIGTAYTATRTIDRAMKDRFEIVEMEYLTFDQEYNLLKQKFPKIPDEILKSIANVANETRKEILKDDSLIDDALSTRAVHKIAEIVEDGFNIMEAYSIRVIPLYEGGSSEAASTPRGFITACIQRFTPVVTISDSELFQKKHANWGVDADQNPFTRTSKP